MLENTPQYHWYEDETQNEQTFPQQAEVLEPTLGDCYIEGEILLQTGDKMARGHVATQSHDASGHIMGPECFRLSLRVARLQY